MKKKVVTGIMLTLLLVGMLMLAFNMPVGANIILPIHLDAEPPILINLTNPVCTQWHELYPTYCNRYNLSGWKDTDGKGVLNKSDYIFLENKDTGKRGRYHVENVTVTLKVTNKSEPFNEFYVEFNGTIWEFPFNNPNGTIWHEVYPRYCNWYQIRGWDDTDGGGNLTVSDQINIIVIQMPLEEGYPVEVVEPIEQRCHVDEVKTNLIVTLQPWKPIDLYADGVINIFDIAIGAKAFGSMAVDDPNTPWDETKNWNPDADLAPPYGLIDIFDLVMIAVQFGKADC